jgi:holliday junction DNA helicase RuvA
MIASLHGTIADVIDDYIVVVVNNIGYKVFTTESAQAHQTGDEIHLHTYLVVREDALTLYGFRSVTQRKLFETLISVSGVGPKVALAILGTLSPENLRNAVVHERVEILTRVPGIGKKTGQKILFELKDKLDIGLEAMPVTEFDDINNDVVDSLIALGYSVVEAQAAVASIPPNAPRNVEERLRLALQYF